MTTHFTYNFVEKTIVGTKASINRANACKEPEYSELCAKMAEHPDFKVEIKVINTKKDKKTYSNLTIKKMEDYISLPNVILEEDPDHANAYKSCIPHVIRPDRH